MDNSPTVQNNKVTTEMRTSFELPSNLFKPTFRVRQNSHAFDEGTQASFRGKRDEKVNSSGFTMNSTLFDGTGWVPEKNLHGD